MRAVIRPGGVVAGEARVPGDKSIAHRWILFAATADGSSRLHGLPPGQDVRSTAACMAELSGSAALADWAREAGAAEDEGQGPTWNEEHGWNYKHEVHVEAEGRGALETPAGVLDCGNSGTTMRFLMGLLSAGGVSAELTGDESLMPRPMERVAEPLRSMGAAIRTTDGHAPVAIEGSALRGIRYETPVASAQVKSAVLLAGLAADGDTTVIEPVTTRTHTEVLLDALGAPIHVDGTTVTVSRFQHPGFEGTVPGDPASAAYLLAAAALTGGSLNVRGVGLNPSRTAFLGVLERMGALIRVSPGADEMGEEAGDIEVLDGSAIAQPVTVDAATLPTVIDEVPILAAVAAHATGESRFEGAGELRVKESDRLNGLAAGLTALGGEARVEGDTLIVGGGGLRGGTGAAASSLADHRLAMAFAVAGMAADTSVAVEGMEAAAVTYPGFHQAVASLGADLEIE